MTRFFGRVFTYTQLFLAMPSITVWLAAAALTGLAVAISRITLLARRTLAVDRRGT